MQGSSCWCQYLADLRQNFNVVFVCFCVAGKVSGLSWFYLLSEERVIDILGWKLVFKISELPSLFISMGAAMSPSILTPGQWVVVDNVYNCKKVMKLPTTLLAAQLYAIFCSVTVWQVFNVLVIHYNIPFFSESAITRTTLLTYAYPLKK